MGLLSISILLFIIYIGNRKNDVQKNLKMVKKNEKNKR